MSAARVPACPRSPAAVPRAGRARDQSAAAAAGPAHSETQSPVIGSPASVGHFPSDPPPSSAGEAIVTGTLDWSETLPGWIGKWRMRWQGADYTWGISGVNCDAAFRNIVREVAEETLGVIGAAMAEAGVVGTRASHAQPARADGRGR